MMQVHWRIAISFLISRIKFPELIVGGWYNGDWSWPDSRCPTAFTRQGGGKSGLRRAGCQVTPGRREPMESATENTPPKLERAGKGEMVR
jgi:hypothetical protein